MSIKSMYYSTIVLVMGTGMSATMAGTDVTLGAGKLLNNTNSNVPGYVVSGRVTATSGAWSGFADYLHIGKSFLAEDAAITTVGAGYTYKRATMTIAEIIGASYSAVVWWDKDDPDNQECYRHHCGKKYPNNGTIFSRACHMCGTAVGVDYALSKRWSVRGQYYGLLHMEPTFQGVVVQVTYSIGL
jgi:hypothetical protein